MDGLTTDFGRLEEFGWFILMLKMRSIEQPVDLVGSEVEIELFEEQSRSSELKLGSPEMLAVKDRLQAESIGNHLGQLTIELHPVAEPLES